MFPMLPVFRPQVVCIYRSNDEARYDDTAQVSLISVGKVQQGRTRSIIFAKYLRHILESLLDNE